MIKAIRNGIVTEFSDLTWKHLSTTRKGKGGKIIDGRDGWEEYKETAPDQRIPVQEVDLSKKEPDKSLSEPPPKTNPVEEKVDGGSEKGEDLGNQPPPPPEKTPDEMRAFLKDKGVSFHHKLGDAKIKKLYDENSK